MARRAYPTDLSDGERAIPAPLLPEADPGGLPCSTDLREVIIAPCYYNTGGVIAYTAGWPV